jgi:hypothetical protein
MWMNKEWNLAQVHLEVFKFFRYAFSELYAMKKNYFKKLRDGEEQAQQEYLSKEEYETLTNEEAFKVTFPVLGEENWRQVLKKDDLDYTSMIYQLRIKSLTGYMESCYFCGDKRCEGCPLPFTSALTYGDMLKKIGVSSNNSYFGDNYSRGKKDFIIEVVWNSQVEKGFFAQFQKAVSFPGHSKDGETTS